MAGTKTTTKKSPAGTKKATALKAQAALAKKVVEVKEKKRLDSWLRIKDTYNMPEEFQMKLDHVLRTIEDGGTPRQAANIGGFTYEELQKLLEAGAGGHPAFAQFFEDFLVMQGRARIDLMTELRNRAKNSDDSFRLYMEFLDEDFRALEGSKRESEGSGGGRPVQIQINTAYGPD